MKFSYLFRSSVWWPVINQSCGVVKRLETCLSPSSAFILFLSFNHGTLKIKVFPLGFMCRKFLLTHEITHGEFGAIKRLNLKYALIPLPCSLRQTLWKSSFLYVIRFYSLFVTIWCKDNKLIIFFFFFHWIFIGLT
jgi:hypothetical protein